MDRYKPLSPHDVGEFYQQITEHILKVGGTAELSYSAVHNQLSAKLTQPQLEGNSIDDLARIFCQATSEVLSMATGQEITFSKTIQKVASVHLKPDVGSFVEFTGDYTGLLITNFSADAAMELYRNQMLYMGLPESELSAHYTSEDVVDTLGELINQMIGKARQLIEQKYGLSAYNSQPKAIALTEAVKLTIANFQDTEYELRRLSFKINGAPFQLELQLEKLEFRV